MAKNSGLGAKISMGFSVLLIIMVILGGMSIYSMGRVSTQAGFLKSEYMPQVQIAAEMLQNMWTLQYNLRGYLMSFNMDYRKIADESQPKVYESLEKATKLANDASQLKELKSATAVFKSFLGEYSAGVPKLEAAVEGIVKARGELTQSGNDLLNTAYEYYNSQRSLLVEEIEKASTPEVLKERATKCRLINEFINATNSIQVRCWTGQANRDNALLEATLADFDAMNTQIEQMRAVTRQEVNLQQLAKIQESLASFRLSLNDALSNSKTLAQLNSAMVKVGQSTRESSQDIATMSVKSTTSIAEAAYTTLRWNMTLLIGGLAGALVLSVILALLIVRSITRPINHIIDELNDVARQTSSAAAEMASTSESLSSSATEQAAVSEETASSIEEIQSQSTHLAELTNGAAEMMKENIRKSGESLKALLEMTQRMTQIEKDSGEMGKIIKTIDEIAFQTNLLALNAAVEAARAGDAGKGFAVVAEEVRALASRAAEAARVTQELLEGTAGRVRETSTAIKKINDNFEAIVETATEMGDKLEQVTAANSEVTQGIDQINKAGQQSSLAAQNVAANSEEMSATAEELSAQAYELGNVVHVLLTVVQGSRAAERAAMLQNTAPPSGRETVQYISDESSEDYEEDSAESHNGQSSISSERRQKVPHS